MKKILLIIALSIIPFIENFVQAWDLIPPVDYVGFEIDYKNNYHSYFAECPHFHYRMIESFYVNLRKYNIPTALTAWREADAYPDCLPSAWDSIIFWSYAPEGVPVIPGDIKARKAYKNGILFLGKHCINICTPSDFYIGFIKYKKNDWLVYVYNEALAPIGSKQNATYNTLYSDDEISALYNDLVMAFNKGKFNNKNTNTVYQNFIRSIR